MSYLEECVRCGGSEIVMSCLGCMRLDANAAADLAAAQKRIAELEETLRDDLRGGDYCESVTLRAKALEAQLADAEKVMEAARGAFLRDGGFGMPIGSWEEGVRALAEYDAKWRAEE